MFNQLTYSLKDSLPVDWEEIESNEQIDELVEESFQHPIVIFKHSMRCGISAMAQYQLEGSWKFSPNELKMYVVDVIGNRSVSQQIAHKFQVVHQSPQILIISAGEVLYHTSHHNISVDVIEQAISSQTP